MLKLLKVRMMICCLILLKHFASAKLPIHLQEFTTLEIITNGPSQLSRYQHTEKYIIKT